jgi:hypothetical protein
MIKFGFVDRFFRLIERHKWPVGVVAFAALLFAFLFRGELERIAGPYQSFFKLLGLIVGPFATIVGFYLGFKAKEELVSHSSNAQDKLTKLAAESDAKLLVQAEKIEAKSHAIGVLQTEVKGSAADLEQSQAALAENQRVLAAERERVGKLDANLRRVTDGGHNLWQAYPARPVARPRGGQDHNSWEPQGRRWQNDNCSQPRGLHQQEAR